MQLHSTHPFNDVDQSMTAVVEAMRSVGLDHEKRKGLRTFLIFALMPPSKNETPPDYARVANTTLQNITEYLRIAIKLRRHYYLNEHDIPEALLAGCAMLAMPDTMHRKGIQMLSYSDHKPVAIGAQCLYDSLVMFDSELPASGERYLKMDIQHRFMIDLHAYMLCRSLSFFGMSVPARISTINAVSRYAGFIKAHHSHLAGAFLGMLSHVRKQIPSLATPAGTPATGAKIYIFQGKSPRNRLT